MTTTSLTWDLEEARALILRRFGKAQLELARQSLGSTIDRQDFAHYHYHEASNFLDAYIAKISSSPNGALRSIFGAADEEEECDFNVRIAKIGAHVTACVQSMHAIADIFAHGVYYALGYNLQSSPLPERGINIRSVTTKLNESFTHKDLGIALAKLSSGDDFKYLSALANHSKHRSLVKPALWHDMTGTAEVPHTLQFQDFVYDGISYPRREIRPFLEAEYNRQALLIVQTGQHLNAALRAL